MTRRRINWQIDATHLSGQCLSVIDHQLERAHDTCAASSSEPMMGLCGSPFDRSADHARSGRSFLHVEIAGILLLSVGGRRRQRCRQSSVAPPQRPQICHVTLPNNLSPRSTSLPLLLHLSLSLCMCVCVCVFWSSWSLFMSIVRQRSHCLDRL